MSGSDTPSAAEMVMLEMCCTPCSRLLDGSVRHHHGVVLVLPGIADCPLLRQHADDPERLVA